MLGNLDYFKVNCAAPGTQQALIFEHCVKVEIYFGLKTSVYAVAQKYSLELKQNKWNIK